MPQKRNPDALELLRGKSGRGLGAFVRLATVMKGLPQAYNKDLQEDKEGLFDVVDTLESCLPIARGVVSTMEPNWGRMRAALSADMLATVMLLLRVVVAHSHCGDDVQDLADYLVRKGVPFRQTHHVAGAAVQLAEQSGRQLSALTLTGSADRLKDAAVIPTNICFSCLSLCVSRTRTTHVPTHGNQAPSFTLWAKRRVASMRRSTIPAFHLFSRSWAFSSETPLTRAIARAETTASTV